MQLQPAYRRVGHRHSTCSTRPWRDGAAGMKLYIACIQKEVAPSVFMSQHASAKQAPAGSTRGWVAHAHYGLAWRQRPVRPTRQCTSPAFSDQCAATGTAGGAACAGKPQSSPIASAAAMGPSSTATLHVVLAASVVVTMQPAPCLKAQTATLLASTQHPHFSMHALSVLHAAQSGEAALQRCLRPTHAGGW